MLGHCGPPNFTATPIADKSLAWSLGITVPYIVVGLFTVFGNLLIVISIARHSEFRQRYFLIAALAGADVINGLGFFLAGAMRLSLQIQRKDTVWTSPLDCMVQPFNICLIIGNQLPVSITAVIAVDRLIVVVHPFQYAHWRVKHRAKQITIFLCFLSLVSVAVAFVASASQTACVEKLCHTSWAVGKRYTDFNYIFTIILGSIALVIYIVIIVVIKRKSLAKSLSRRARSPSVNQQLRLTSMLAFVVIFTFFALILPILGLLIISSLPTSYVEYSEMAPMFGVLFCANSGIAVVIYAVRHPDFKRAFRATLCPCKVSY